MECLQHLILQLQDCKEDDIIKELKLLVQYSELLCELNSYLISNLISELNQFYK